MTSLEKMSKQQLIDLKQSLVSEINKIQKKIDEYGIIDDSCYLMKKKINIENKIKAIKQILDNN